MEEIVVRGIVIDQLLCVLEDDDAGESSIFTASDEYQYVLVDLIESLYVLPEIQALGSWRTRWLSGNRVVCAA